MTIFLSGWVDWDNDRHDDDYDGYAIGGRGIVCTLECFNGERVHCCWAFDEKSIGVDDFLQIACEVQFGNMEAYTVRGYSEATGDYGWSDAVIGGHDLRAVFGQNKHKYGALLVSTDPIDLLKLAEADAYVSYYWEGP